MSDLETPPRSMRVRHWLVGSVASVAVWCATQGGWLETRAVLAQEAGPNPAASTEVERAVAEKLKQVQAAPTDVQPGAPHPAAPAVATSSPSLFDLWFQGGPLMFPITLMSFVVVVFSIERFLGLRRPKIIPDGLVASLGQMAGRQGGLDPRQAYKVCQQFPSTASTVIRAVLLKVGRPHSEVELTVKESSEREAAKLYKNVRWINLATTVTPLIGLLGTVQGMIDCFYRTANLPPGANRTEALAGGIYVALVTTFGGLVVAIPASVLAHYFEGKIQALFREVDELLLGLLPQLERFEGKMRLSRQAGVSESEVEGAIPLPPPVAMRQ